VGRKGCKNTNPSGWCIKSTFRVLLHSKMHRESLMGNWEELLVCFFFGGGGGYESAKPDDVRIEVTILPLALPFVFWRLKFPNHCFGTHYLTQNSSRRMSCCENHVTTVYFRASQLMWHRNTFWAVRYSVRRAEMNTHFAIISLQLLNYYGCYKFLSDTQNSLQGHQGCREHADDNPEPMLSRKSTKASGCG
jgi:hypothetical protein